MSTIRWIISENDYQDYSKNRLNRPSANQIRKYYGGFRMQRDEIFGDELSDLEKVYTATLDEMQENISNILPTMLVYMDKFLEYNKKSDVIREKLECLKAKIGERA